MERDREENLSWCLVFNIDFPRRRAKPVVHYDHDCEDLPFSRQDMYHPSVLISLFQQEVRVAAFSVCTPPWLTTVGAPYNPSGCTRFIPPLLARLQVLWGPSPRPGFSCEAARSSQRRGSAFSGSSRAKTHGAASVQALEPSRLPCVQDEGGIFPPAFSLSSRGLVDFCQFFVPPREYRIDAAVCMLGGFA